MVSSQIIFVTSNPYKTQEVRAVGRDFGISVTDYKLKIEELQTEDTEKLVRTKALAAFSELRLPVIVDHAGLHMDCLEGLPGNLTQLFWDRIGGQGLCDIAGIRREREARAVTTIAYCDTRRIHIFSAFRSGSIADRPRGARRFQWDTIFVPEGQSRTYAQMKIADKNAISQRGEALRSMFEHLVKNNS